MNIINIDIFIVIHIVVVVILILMRVHTCKMRTYMRIQMFCVTLNRFLYKCTCFKKNKKNTYVHNTYWGDFCGFH